MVLDLVLKKGIKVSTRVVVELRQKQCRPKNEFLDIRGIFRISKTGKQQILENYKYPGFKFSQLRFSHWKTVKTRY